MGWYIYYLKEINIWIDVVSFILLVIFIFKDILINNICMLNIIIFSFYIGNDFYYKMYCDNVIV